MTSFQQIANALGPDYILEVKPETDFNDRPIEPTRATFRHKCKDKEWGVFIYYSSYEKKLFISGHYTKTIDDSKFDKPYASDWPKIGCSPDKEAKKIAKDITNRFLPIYEPMFTLAVVWRDAHNAYQDRQKINKQIFMDMFGLTEKEDNYDKRFRNHIHIPMGNCDVNGYIGDLEVYDKTINFNMRSLPIDKAVLLLTYWKSLCD